MLQVFLYFCMIKIIFMIRRLNSLEGVEDLTNYLDYDEPLLEYVSKLTSKIFPVNELEFECGFFESKAYSNFVYRYHKGQLKESIAFKKSPDEFIRKFEADKESLEIITEMGYDIEKFCYLALLVNDISFVACLNQKDDNPSPVENITKFSDLIGENLKIIDNEINLKKDIEIKLSIGGRKKMLITDKYTLSLLCLSIESFKESLTDDSIFHKLQTKIYKSTDLLNNRQQTLSFSMRIWYFATIFRYFFDIEPKKKQAKRNSYNSTSIYYLISRMVYLFELTINEKFLESSDSLVGFLKQYEFKDFNNYLLIYGCQARVGF